MVHLRITCQVICVQSVQWTKLKLPQAVLMVFSSCEVLKPWVWWSQLELHMYALQVFTCSMALSFDCSFLLSHQPAKGDFLLYETLQTPSGSVVKSTSVVTAGENG